MGWYWYASCSGDQEIADTSSLIHEFYASEVEESDPIHITVDTHLLDDSLKIRAYEHRILLLAMFSKCSQHQSNWEGHLVAMLSVLVPGHAVLVDHTDLSRRHVPTWFALRPPPAAGFHRFLGVTLLDAMIQCMPWRPNKLW